MRVRILSHSYEQIRTSSLEIKLHRLLEAAILDILYQRFWMSRFMILTRSHLSAGGTRFIISIEGLATISCLQSNI